MGPDELREEEAELLGVLWRERGGNLRAPSAWAPEDDLRAALAERGVELSRRTLLVLEVRGLVETSWRRSFGTRPRVFRVRATALAWRSLLGDGAPEPVA